MSIWRCPICVASMQKQEKGIRCLNGHCFDVAKSGYVNLLPVQQKRTKQPGDNSVSYTHLTLPTTERV